MKSFGEVTKMLQKDQVHEMYSSRQTFIFCPKLQGHFLKTEKVVLYLVKFNDKNISSLQ